MRSVFLFPALLVCIYKLSFEATTARNCCLYLEEKLERPLVDHPTLEAGTLQQNLAHIVKEH